MLQTTCCLDWRPNGAIKKLVWYEVHTDIMEAIRREKQIKKWERRWKVELIEKSNANWCDLYTEIVD